METSTPKANQKQLMKLTKKELCEIILRKDEAEDAIEADIDNLKANISNLKANINTNEKKYQELSKLYKTYILDNDNLITKCDSLTNKLFKYRLLVVALVIVVMILGVMMIL